MRKKMIAGIGMVLMAGIAFAPLALLEADGLVTEKSAGWRFEASE